MGGEQVVYIVDDDRGVRGALAALVRSIGLGSEAFDTAAAFFAAVDRDRAGCAIIDLRLEEGVSGLDVQAEMTRRGVDLPVIIVTGYGTVPDSSRAFRAGAVDFLQKPFSPQTLLERINEALRLDRERRSSAARRAELEQCLARLTPREREVMKLLETGRTSKEVASALDLSVRTVEGYRSEVLRKLGVASVSQMVRRLTSLGLKER